MLLEETVRTCLGDNGDLVFIEQSEEEGNESVEETRGQKPKTPKYGGTKG